MKNKYNVSKYLGFKSLKGFDDLIKEEDNKTLNVNTIYLTENKKELLDVLLINAYKSKKDVIVTYYKKGTIKQYKGIITFINMIEKTITINKKINLDSYNIVDISME